MVVNAFFVLRIWKTSVKNLDVNSDPLSESSSVCGPQLIMKFLTNSLATLPAANPFIGTDFESLVKQCVFIKT